MAITTIGVAIAALVASIAGTATAVVSQGISAKRAADFQSQVARQQADRAQLVADANEADFRKSVSRKLAAARTAVIAAGGDPGSGSQLLSFEDFAEEAELDALTIRNQGIVQASRLDQQATLLRQGGREAQTAGFIRGGASLLSGIGRVGSFGGGGGGGGGGSGGFLNESTDFSQQGA